MHDSKNLYTPTDQLRPIRIPDVNPAALPEGGSLAMAAGDWMDIFSDLPSDYIHGAFQRMTNREKRRHQKFEQQRREWDAARREHAKVAAAATAAGLPIPPAPEMADKVLLCAFLILCRLLALTSICDVCSKQTVCIIVWEERKQ